MQTCPHCQREGVTNLQKALSLYFGPAECAFCHGKSHVHVVNALIAMRFWMLITWLFIGLCWMSRSSFFLLGSAPAMYLAVNKYVLGAPLLAIPRA